MEYLGHSFIRNVTLYSFRASSWAYLVSPTGETLYNISKDYICKNCQVSVLISNNENTIFCVKGFNVSKLLSCTDQIIKNFVE